MKLKSEKEKYANLIRKRCFCGSPMHPKGGYYRCYNCHKEFPFTKREEKFWKSREL